MKYTSRDYVLFLQVAYFWIMAAKLCSDLAFHDGNLDAALYSLIAAMFCSLNMFLTRKLNSYHLKLDGLLDIILESIKYLDYCHNNHKCKHQSNCSQKENARG